MNRRLLSLVITVIATTYGSAQKVTHSVLMKDDCDDCAFYKKIKDNYDPKESYEETFLYFNDNQTHILYERLTVAAAAPLIGAGVDVGLNALQRLLKARAEKFSASYKVSQGEETFFEDRPESMTFIRVLNTKNKKDTVFSMTFAIEYSSDANESFFRFKPTSMRYVYAKSKVRSKVKKCKKGLDMTVSIVVNGAWIDKGDNPQNKKLGANDFLFENLKFSCYRKLESKKYKSHWIPVINGPTNFVVSVLEVDDKQKRLEKIAKFIDDTRGDVSKGITSYLKE